MKTSEKQMVFTYLIGKLIVYANEVLRADLSQREVWREKRRQEDLVKQGFSKTLNSKHLQALASDFVLFRDGKPVWDSNDPLWVAIGEYGEDIGLTWGGRWGWDAGHFEYKERDDT